MPIGVDENKLIQRCLTHQPGAWNEFVDAYLGLIYRIIHHTAHLRGVTLQPEDVEDLASDVLLQLVANNYSVLRQFQGRSTLATYLTVIVRRSCIHLLARKFGTTAIFKSMPVSEQIRDDSAGDESSDALEHVHDLLTKLPRGVREVVRLHYLVGLSYEEISSQLGIPVNSIGPLLSRARQKLRTKLQSDPGFAAKPTKHAGVA
ncbi:MAG TPA: sigma-70 family RNA polymerase sigma factor [Gemmatales bacterium]|nr:sigma-70 family RNA polymerase sigma factor [Gemmatales bacterium]